jgi:hypothetical protein
MAETAVMPIRGIVRGNTVTFADDSNLPDGTEVSVTPVEPPIGTGAAILKALAEAPHVSREDVGELRRLIEEGRRLPGTHEDTHERDDHQ